MAQQSSAGKRKLLRKDETPRKMSSIQQAKGSERQRQWGQHDSIRLFLLWAASRFHRYLQCLETVRLAFWANNFVESLPTGKVLPPVNLLCHALWITQIVPGLVCSDRLFSDEQGCCQFRQTFSNKNCTCSFCLVWLLQPPPVVGSRTLWRVCLTKHGSSQTLGAMFVLVLVPRCWFFTRFLCTSVLFHFPVINKHSAVLTWDNLFSELWRPKA